MRRLPSLLLLACLASALALAEPALANEEEVEPESGEASEGKPESDGRALPARQQGAESEVPPDFDFRTFQRAHARRARLQGGLLLGLGAVVLVAHVPGTFLVGLLLLTASEDGPLGEGDVGIMTAPFAASQFGAHITFAAVAAIVRGAMEFRIAAEMGRLFTDSRRRRRQLLTGWVPATGGAAGPPPHRPWGLRH